MSLASSQQHTLLPLLARLRPHWRHDRTLPGRIHALLASDHRFGSRDRRLYRELIYTTLRYLPWIEPELDRDADRATRMIAWLAAVIPATERFRGELLADWPPCPPTLDEKSAVLAASMARGRSEFPGHASPNQVIASDAFAPEALLPGWFGAHCPAAFERVQLEALLARAPLWLRLQTDDPLTVRAEIEPLGWRARPSDVLPSALQLLDEVDVTRTKAYQGGLLEVQDLGSQLLLPAAGIAPGGRWLDACAGAGGKTLQLAALLGSAAAIDAHDVRRTALNELAVRAARAGLTLTRATSACPAASRTGAPAANAAASVRIVPTVSETDYDGVLVDAPCSGSGTWRRAPHLKWTTTPEHIEQAAARQNELLDRYSQHVRPGGRLIYATCSLSSQENQDVIAAFLSRRAEFSVEPPACAFGAKVDEFGLTLFPALHNTDGFFVSCLRRR